MNILLRKQFLVMTPAAEFGRLIRGAFVKQGPKRETFVFPPFLPEEMKSVTIILRE
jgi:hypothetical protein